MTYFSFQVLYDIIYNYHRPPETETNSLKTIIFNNKKNYQRYQKINEQKQRYLHRFNKSASSGSHSINKCRALALKKICWSVQNLTLCNTSHIKIVYHTCQKTKVKAEGHRQSLLLCNCLPSNKVIRKGVLWLGPGRRGVA